MRPAIVRVAIALGLCLLIALGAATALRPDRGLLDFGAFVMAGEAYQRGLDPYEVHADLAEESGLDFGVEGRPYSPNLNPPISLYPFSMLSEVDAMSARDALNAASALLYAGACLFMLRAYPWQRRPLIVLWLFAVAGFWYTLWLGQIYVALFALLLTAWLLLERGHSVLLAGVLIGLTVAIKPNFALWPLLLLLAGHGRPALVATATALAVSAVPLLLESPAVYAQWLEAAREYSRAAISANASLFGMAERVGLPPLGYLLSAAAVVACAVFVRRMRPSQSQTSSLGIVLTLLIGPLSWVGYTLFMLPVLLSRRWGRWEVAIAASMLLPAGLDSPAGELRLAGVLLLGGVIVAGISRSTYPSELTNDETSPQSSAALGQAA